MGTQVQAKQVTFESITQAVASHYHIKIEELFNKKRTKNIAYPRQIAMYLCREMADLSYPRIGELFGGRDHTTVIHAFEKISKTRKTDLELQNDLTKITEMIKQ